MGEQEHDEGKKKKKETRKRKNKNQNPHNQHASLPQDIPETSCREVRFGFGSPPPSQAYMDEALNGDQGL